MLDQQITFLTETDKLKSVERKTSPIGLKRKENSAEHSWQVILAAMILAGHSKEPIILLRVIQMLAIHDIVEIDTGDVFHYAKQDVSDLEAQEQLAANRIYGLLPAHQAQELELLRQEFEARETPESKFAHSVDRLMAFIMNANNEGGTWREFNLTREQVLDKNSHVAEGAPTLYSYIESITAQAVEQRFLK
ncbi:MAG: HD domain-containing protein [Fimbriimonadaceae bacterium]|nr:MAG: HD domain-containing protein [Fimbriimonadaceae bacterium]